MNEKKKFFQENDYENIKITMKLCLSKSKQNDLLSDTKI